MSIQYDNGAGKKYQFHGIMNIIIYRFNIKDSHVNRSGNLGPLIIKSVSIKNGSTRII